MDYSKNPISAQIKIKGSSKLFIEDLIIEDSEGSSSGIIKTFDVNKEVYRDSEFKEKKGSYDNSNEDQISYFRKKQLEIFLSKKISAILYFKNNWGKTKRINNFKPLNDFRNSIDFIHPSFEVSQSGSLKEKMDSKEAYKKCIKLLSFINSDLLT
jgi:excinuclease UvrABC ATPase subunit